MGQLSIHVHLVTDSIAEFYQCGLVDIYALGHNQIKSYFQMFPFLDIGLI